MLLLLVLKQKVIKYWKQNTGNTPALWRGSVPKKSVCAAIYFAVLQNPMSR